jgi:hypothetical protein
MEILQDIKLYLQVVSRSCPFFLSVWADVPKTIERNSMFMVERGEVFVDSVKNSFFLVSY